MYTKWRNNKWDIFVNYIARQAWNIMIKVYYICMIDDYLLYQGKNEQNENGSTKKFSKTITWRTLILTV